MKSLNWLRPAHAAWNWNGETWRIQNLNFVSYRYIYYVRWVNLKCWFWSVKIWILSVLLRALSAVLVLNRCPNQEVCILCHFTNYVWDLKIVDIDTDFRFPIFSRLVSMARRIVVERRRLWIGRRSQIPASVRRGDRDDWRVVYRTSVVAI